MSKYLIDSSKIEIKLDKMFTSYNTLCLKFRSQCVHVACTLEPSLNCK